MQLSHEWSRATAVFDDPNLVSCAGLAPVLALAEQAGLAGLIEDKVRLVSTKVRSAGVNPAGKLTALIAGMCADADSIADVEVIRAGGLAEMFGGVYASVTVGQLLREFTYGHTQQLASVARAHLIGLVQRTGCLPGIGEQAVVDIDSLLRPVYGHAKQGASFGHTKIAGKQVLRRGLSPLATTISTPTAAPMITGILLRAAGPARARARPAWSPRRSAPPGPPARPGRCWSAATPPTAASRYQRRAG